MARKGGKSHKIYAETCGIKVSGGQVVKSGAVLTRQGDRWKPGINVQGRMHLTAACAGEKMTGETLSGFASMQAFEVGAKAQLIAYL